MLRRCEAGSASAAPMTTISHRCSVAFHSFLGPHGGHALKQFLHMVATLGNRYERRNAGLGDEPERRTRDDPIEVLGRVRLDHEPQGNASSNGPAAHERLVRDKLVEPRERRKDYLLDEPPTCVRRRHVPGFHLVDFDQEKHETSRCICLAPRPPRNRRAVYVAPGGSDKKARAWARR